jgi:hypothetical protein
MDQAMKNYERIAPEASPGQPSDKTGRQYR